MDGQEDGRYRVYVNRNGSMHGTAGHIDEPVWVIGSDRIGACMPETCLIFVFLIVSLIFGSLFLTIRSYGVWCGVAGWGDPRENRPMMHENPYKVTKLQAYNNATGLQVMAGSGTSARSSACMCPPHQLQRSQRSSNINTDVVWEEKRWPATYLCSFHSNPRGRYSSFSKLLLSCVFFSIFRFAFEFV